jgi:HSP20 family molecular chaperone IbpA
MLPYVMVRNMFDEMADSAFSAHSTNGIMRTDIRESDTGYEVAIDLPGVKKEDLSAELKDNYLVVSATVGQPEEDNGEHWRYLRRERFVGTLRRSFYVGDKIEQDNIHAKFEDGTLYLNIPKAIPVAQVEQKNLIAIEG